MEYTTTNQPFFAPLYQEIGSIPPALPLPLLHVCWKLVISNQFITSATGSESVMAMRMTLVVSWFCVLLVQYRGRNNLFNVEVEVNDDVDVDVNIEDDDNDKDEDNKTWMFWTYGDDGDEVGRQ